MIIFSKLLVAFLLLEGTHIEGKNPRAPGSGGRAGNGGGGGGGGESESESESGGRGRGLGNTNRGNTRDGTGGR
jgi:hypothetical protein